MCCALLNCGRHSERLQPHKDSHYAVCEVLEVFMVLLCA